MKVCMVKFTGGRAKVVEKIWIEILDQIFEGDVYPHQLFDDESPEWLQGIYISEDVWLAIKEIIDTPAQKASVCYDEECDYIFALDAVNEPIMMKLITNLFEGEYGDPTMGKEIVEACGNMKWNQRYTFIEGAYQPGMIVDVATPVQEG